MFGLQLDHHHVRTFGALAYVHVPLTPARRQQHVNAKIGYVLGYVDDVVGCKVYFPADGTCKFAADIRVNESVLYRDRHHVSSATLAASDWLRFQDRARDSCPTLVTLRWMLPVMRHFRLNRPPRSFPWTKSRFLVVHLSTSRRNDAALGDAGNDVAECGKVNFQKSILYRRLEVGVVLCFALGMAIWPIKTLV